MLLHIAVLPVIPNITVPGVMNWKFNIQMASSLSPIILLLKTACLGKASNLTSTSSRSFATALPKYIPRPRYEFLADS